MSDAKSHGETAQRTRDEQELSCDTDVPSSVGEGHNCDLAADYARLAQALRDVRHLLPPEGVVIVDDALAGMRSGEAPLFEPNFESARARALN